MIDIIIKKLHIFIFLLLLITPFIIYGNNYLVGGDDTRLYYIFPLDFIRNYAVNIASDNTLAGAMTGYASVAYYIPFFLFIYILKFVPIINTQMLMYGFNMVLAFASFYKLTGLYIDHKNGSEKYISLFGALFYVFSTYIVKTHYTHQMISMYLVSVLPFCFYLFINSVRKKDIRYSIVSVLFFSIFSTGLNTLPWWGGFLIASLPLLIFELLINKNTFIKSLAISVILYVLLNSYWVFHYIYPYINKQNTTSVSQNYMSDEFLNDNLRVASGVSRSLSPLNIVLNKMDYGLKETSVGFLDIIPFFILLAGILLSVKKNNNKKLIFNLFLIGFLISWFLFSPNLGEWGPKLFLYLSRNVPYFTMFRNMHDKFSIPLAMYWALLLTVSLIFIRRSSKIIFTILYFLVFLYFSIISLPQYVRISKSATETYSVFNGRFNEDFNELTDYLNRSDDHSKILWLPLNGPTYLNISGEKENEFYSGLSPIKILTGKTDYAGRFSFIVGEDYFLGDDIFSMIKEERYQEFGEFLKRLNISYIIVSNEIIPEKFLSFQYGGDGLPILDMQNDPLFFDKILGEHVKDFGSRYELYRIIPKYESSKFYLVNEGFAKPLDYKKINSEKYLVNIDEKAAESIVFSELKSGYWIMKSGNTILNKLESDEYSNIWHLNNQKPTSQQHIVEFLPRKYNFVANIVSVLTALTLMIYLIRYFIYFRLNPKP